MKTRRQRPNIQKNVEEEDWPVMSKHFFECVSTFVFFVRPESKIESCINVTESVFALFSSRIAKDCPPLPSETN